MYHCTATNGRPSLNVAALLTLSTFLLPSVSTSDAAASPPLPAAAAAYKNYTVGDSLGWYDSLENPKVDYQKWVAAKKFSLGDFLIFNTDNNHSVIQTYNFTTYKSCDYEDASDKDTIQWAATDPSSTSPHPVSVAVPLLKVGPTYLFSGDYDGEQCQNGQHFTINVTYGHGLPPSLRNPADGAPVPANPDAANGDSAPDTLVPSNFDHPQDVGDADTSQPSKSINIISSFFGVKFYGFLVLLGIYGTI